MENFDQSNDHLILDQLDTAAVSKSFIANVFSWMFAALLISGGVSWFFAQSDYFWSLYNPEGPSMLGYVVMFAPLLFVLGLGAGFNRFSYGTLTVLFIAFSAVMGVSFSYIFFAYSLGSIMTVFFASAAVFGVMALAGYRTNTDLTKMGSLLFMGLIGIIIASVINMFLGSAMMDYVISIIGVLIFVGLTAYDMQKIKRMSMVLEEGTESTKKMVLMGALSLYLDFINLFLLLLRLFGSRD